MLNSDYENDLFYVITANVMTTTSLVGYALLCLNTIVSYNKFLYRLFGTIVCFALLSYMFVPVCCKLMQGYDINYIYIAIFIKLFFYRFNIII